MKNQEINQQVKWELDTETEKKVYMRAFVILHLLFYAGMFYYFFF